MLTQTSEKKSQKM